MKFLIGLTAASAFVVNVNAQSADDGFKLVAFKKYESAVAAMKPLAEKNPEAAIPLGIAYLEMGKVNEAKAAFSMHPTEWTSKIGQAYIYMHDNNVAQAETLLNAVVDGAKKKEWMKYKYAADVITYSGKGSTQSAITWYEKSLTINEQASTHLSFGNFYLNRLNNGGEAYNQYNAAANNTVDKSIQSLAYSQLGSIGLRSTNADLAITNFDKAKAADPNNPLPYIQLAKQYDKVGKGELAKENIEKFFELSDKTYIDKIDYVNVLIGAKEFAKAEGTLNELLKTNADEPLLYRAMAYSQYENKKPEEALTSINTYFNKSTDKTKITVEDFNYAGKIYASLSATNEEKKTEYIGKAHEYFAKAVAADTNVDKRNTYNEIGNIFKNANNYEGAAMYYNKIVADNPKASTFDYFNAGFASYLADKPAEALSTFTQMATQYPDEPVAVYWQATTAAALDPQATEGTAEPFFEKWLAIQKEGYTQSDKDKVKGYSYLLVYNMNKKNYAKAKDYVAQILAIDPENAYAKDVKDFLAKVK